MNLLPNLELISITEKLPEPNQDVIGWNGIYLVAAKYVLNTNFSDTKGNFQVEKYPCKDERVYVSNWSTITHWMPAYYERKQ